MDLIQRDTVQRKAAARSRFLVPPELTSRNLASHHHLGAVVAEGLPEATLAFAQASRSRRYQASVTPKARAR